MNRIVLVTKPSRLEMLRQQHLTEGAAAFLLHSNGQSIDEYRREDTAYVAALTKIQRQLPNDIPFATVSREELPHFLFRDTDLIVVCGPDGLFANVAAYLSCQPIITVNPDPYSVAGALMLFQPEQVGGAIAKVLSGKYNSEAIPLIKATIDGELTIWGINDLFIGRKDHISARYSLTYDKRSEQHSSSGIIVSTGLGSSGWIRSVLTMVAGITGSIDTQLRLPKVTEKRLLFIVREPFPSPNTATNIIVGYIGSTTVFEASSAMADGGYVFCDGVIEQAVPWNAGSRVVVSVGDRHVTRVLP